MGEVLELSKTTKQCSYIKLAASVVKKSNHDNLFSQISEWFDSCKNRLN